MATVAQALEIAVREIQAGRLAQAEDVCRRVLEAEPEHPDASHLLGVIAHQAGRHDLAVEFLSNAVARRPDFAEARYNLALALQAMDRHDEAVAHHDILLAQKPDWADARNNRANALKSLGRLEEAVAGYGDALALDPGYADAHYNLGTAFQESGRLDQAVASFQRALALRPDAPHALNNLGNTLLALGQAADAIECYNRAIALAPRYVEAYSNLGRAYKDLADQRRDPTLLDEAIASYRRAIAVRPDFAEAHNGLGYGLYLQGDLAQAMESLRTAIALRPTLAEACNNAGLVLKLMGRYEDAIAMFDRAEAVNPSMADASVNRAYARLVHGQFKAAWTDYERRWQSLDQYPKRPFPQPWWNGEPLDGRELLIWGEQGLGDQLMCAGMVPDVVRLGGRCLFECDPRLVDLVARSFPSVTVLPKQTPPHERTTGADVQVPAFSLARLFRREASDFPSHSGYLRADPVKVDRWRTWLDGLGPGPKVGLCWRSRVIKWEHALAFPPVEALSVILRTPGVTFVNLQYDGFLDDIETMRRLTGVEVHTPTGIDLTNDLDDVAALTAALDAVVGAATAAVTLAGALGRPGWVFAYYPMFADVAMCNRDHMPWCPSIRAEKCRHGEDWGTTLARVADGLRELFA